MKVKRTQEEIKEGSQIMMWVDYTIDQVGKNFKVKGDWEGEVMGVQRDGTPKDHYLYKPGDRFIVNENGWLCFVPREQDDE